MRLYALTAIEQLKNKQTKKPFKEAINFSVIL